MVAAGINDWGGVSPVTPDHVNPEAPWPALDRLAQRTADAGKVLVERLAIYSEYAREPARWLDPALRTPVLRAVDAQDLARPDAWIPGAGTPPSGPRASRPQMRPGRPRSNLSDILGRATAGETLDETDIVRLFQARGDEFDNVCAAADGLRRAVNGDTVTYVVTRNINYTNVCYYRCQFCAFSKGKLSENLRGKPELLSVREVVNRCHEAVARGATEVCMQGGIHPSFTGDFYVDLLQAIKEELPGLHVHAYSPLEVHQGAETAGRSVAEQLRLLKDAGLGTLPGTAA